MVVILESIRKMRDFWPFLVNFSKFDDVTRRTGWSVRFVLPMFDVFNPGYVVYSIYGSTQTMENDVLLFLETKGCV